MNARLLCAPVLLAALAAAAPAAPPDPAAVAAKVDRLIADGNAGKPTREAPALDDLPFLRRASVDLTGRIPTEADIRKFQALPAGERRAKAIDDLMGREQFPDRWAVFFGDMLRVRSGTDGGAAFQAYVHEALRTNLPYDELARRLIAAGGKAGAQPETGFVLADEADPMALTGIVSQVFLGVRMQCAQCHDHPFDKWSREEFYDLAAFFGKTRKLEQRVRMTVIGVYVQETEQTSILWPPEDKAKGKPRTAVKPEFPFKLDDGDGPNKHLARLKELRDAQAAAVKATAAKKVDSVDDLLDGAAEKVTGKKVDDVTAEAKAAAKKLDLLGDAKRVSDLRKSLASHVTDPRNRYFSRTIVNRVWAELVGRGFVNPVDDFKDDNPPSHPAALDFLADEFVASGYDFRFLVRTITQTAAYQRGHLPMTVPAPDRLAAETAFTATPVRRMVSEAMFDSIVQAGHLFSPKHRPGENLVTITSYVQVPAGTKEDPKPLRPLNGKAGAGMAAMPAGAMPAGGYDLEQGIEVDFKSALKMKDGIEIDAMAAKSKEELEAESMMKSGMVPGKRVRYVTREVQTQIDDNPKFTSSMRIASPAPVGHFLRVFGQTDRSALDERRDHSPSMRQALLMLNGKLTNEAARVGPLEPMYELVAGPKADLDAAIKLAYREILTREPTPEEVTDAKAIVKDAGGPLDGIADLRWALFNSNEFRFIP